MGLDILLRDSAKSARYRSSHGLNLVSKVCGLYAFSLMPDLRVVLSVEAVKTPIELEGDDSDWDETNSEKSHDSDRGSRLHFDRPGNFVYDYEAYIQSSSLKFNLIFIPCKKCNMDSHGNSMSCHKVTAVK